MFEQKDLQKFSLGKIIRHFGHVANEDLGLEREISCEQERSIGQVPGAGIGQLVIPFEALFRGRTTGRRDLGTGTFSQGGAFVQTDVSSDPISALRNQAVALRLGATVLTGLKGNLNIPRVTQPAALVPLREVQGAIESQMFFDQVSLTPHRLMANVIVSRQLLLQSSPDLEAWLRQQLTEAAAVKVDQFIFQGTGADAQVTGLFATPGVSTVTFGGTATWASVLAMKAALTTKNAFKGRPAFVTTPSVRQIWGNIPKGGGLNSANPAFLWEDPWPLWPDSLTDGVIAGCRAADTNNMPNNQVVFADWSSVLAGFFGGIDIQINPFGGRDPSNPGGRDLDFDTNSQVRIVINLWFDCAVQHPESVCVSADAGNQ